MAVSGKKLGKLSLAIFENFVEETLGKKFVEELRAPTDLRTNCPRVERPRHTIGETTGRR